MAKFYTALELNAIRAKKDKAEAEKKMQEKRNTLSEPYQVAWYLSSLEGQEFMKKNWILPQDWFCFQDRIDSNLNVVWLYENTPNSEKKYKMIGKLPIYNWQGHGENTMKTCIAGSEELLSIIEKNVIFY